MMKDNRAELNVVNLNGQKIKCLVQGGFASCENIVSRSQTSSPSLLSEHLLLNVLLACLS